MAGFRKLPSGKWQATVRHPASGKRHTQTDKLRSVVKRWADALEVQFARGDLRDPRAGNITVGDWYERWFAARGVEPGTRDKIDSIWRTHCEPQWGRWPMDSVTRMEALEWAKALQHKHRARHRGVDVAPGDDAPSLAAATVHAAVHVMSSLYGAAASEHPPIVPSNPFAGLGKELPRIAPHAVDFYEHAEVEAIVAAMRKLRPREPQWPIIVEVGTWVGLRPGEIFGLAGSRVDWLRGLVRVTQVQTRDGLRSYPKSRKSHRAVPVPPQRGTLEAMSTLMLGRDRDDLVFTSSLGGPIDDSRFRHRVWMPALREAGVRIFPPRIMRHTAASWLVMDGVPLYDVQALLGHESFATTQRYAHLQPDAHSRVLDAWSRRGLA